MRWTFPYRLLLSALLLAAAYGSISAQIPRVEAALDSASVQVGGKRTLRLRIAYAPGVRILDPGASLVDTAKALELLEESPWDTVSKTQQSIVIQKDLLFTAWDSGFFELPAIPVPYELPGRVDTVYTKALLLEAHLTPPDTVALKPLKPIIEEPLNAEDIVPYLLGLFATLALAAIAWWFWKRRRQRPEPAPTPVEAPPPAAVALEKLEALEKARLWQQGRIKEYHTELSYILREFLENRFHILALESSSREIADQLKEKVDEDQLQNIIQLLHTSDMVKFAKAEPPESVHEQLLAQARELVKSEE
jgi:hypothetical protein